MSQLVVWKNGNGAVLGTDSKAIHFGPSGDHKEIDIERLVQLSEHAVILAGGAAEAVNMCQALQKFVKEEKLVDADEIYRAALPFLSSEYERFMRKACEVLPLDPIHYVYFILGGYASREGEDPFRLYFVWARKKLPQLDGEEISTAYTVPRRIGLELTLNQLSKSNAPMEEALKVVQEGMGKLEQLDELRRPFRFATVDGGGVKMHP
jgi:hypothetical protein